MYVRKVRLDHPPNFLIVLSLFPDSLSSIAAPAQREVVSTIFAIIHFSQSKGAYGQFNSSADL